MIRSAVENTAMAAFMATSVAAGLLDPHLRLELGTTRPQASSYAYIGIGLTSLVACARMALQRATRSLYDHALQVVSQVSEFSSTLRAGLIARRGARTTGQCNRIPTQQGLPQRSAAAEALQFASGLGSEVMKALRVITSRAYSVTWTPARFVCSRSRRNSGRWDANSPRQR